MSANKIYFSVADREATHTVSHTAVTCSDKHVDILSYLIKESTPTIQVIAEPNFEEKFESGT